jgi:hypothetical protein
MICTAGIDDEQAVDRQINIVAELSFSCFDLAKSMR